MWVNDMNHEKLGEWHTLANRLKALKKTEVELRKHLFSSIFLDPEEGKNNINISDEYVLSATYNLIRKIDIEKMTEVLESLGEGSKEFLLKSTTSLNLNNYKTLSSEDRNIVDKALIVSPGLPSMRIIKRCIN